MPLVLHYGQTKKYLSGLQKNLRAERNIFCQPPGAVTMYSGGPLGLTEAYDQHL